MFASARALGWRRPNPYGRAASPIPARLHRPAERFIPKFKFGHASMALAMLLCLIASSACTTRPAAAETPAMTSDMIATAAEPTPDAEQIGRRFLKLIESLTSLRDLDLARIKHVMGLALEKAGHGDFYGAEGNLAGAWKYALNFHPAKSSMANRFELHFIQPGKRFADMTPICKLGFQHYHDALQAMGFTAVPLHDEIGRLQSWRYSKYSPADGRVSIALTITPQNIVPGEDGPLCVKSIATIN